METRNEPFRRQPVHARAGARDDGLVCAKAVGAGHARGSEAAARDRVFIDGVFVRFECRVLCRALCLAGDDVGAVCGLWVGGKCVFLREAWPDRGDDLGADHGAFGREFTAELGEGSMVISLMVLLLVPIIWVGGLILGVVASLKVRPVYIVLWAILLTVTSCVFMYNMAFLPAQYGQIGQGADAVVIRETAVDFAMAKLLAKYAMIGAVVAYAVGCIAGLIRQKKLIADA